NDLLVPADRRHLTEQIERFGTNLQREVRPELYGALVKDEGQIRRQAARAGLERGEGGRKTGDVLRCAAVTNVEVHRVDRRTLQNRTYAADHEELYPGVLEPSDHLFHEVRQHAPSLQQPAPAFMVAQALRRRHAQHLVDQRVIDIAAMAKV